MAHIRQEASRLSLVGLGVPSVQLTGCDGEVIDVHGLADAVLYFYPGSRTSPLEDDTPTVDAVLHRAYRYYGAEFTRRGFQVFGVSSEDTAAQARITRGQSLTHALLSDPECRLGLELGLPTFQLDDVLRYQRLALVMCDGLIRQVFFPVLSANHHPRRVLSWIGVRVCR
jgi:peroxiredoxin